VGKEIPAARRLASDEECDESFEEYGSFPCSG